MKFAAKISIYPGKTSNYTKIPITILPAVILFILLWAYALSWGKLPDNQNSYQVNMPTTIESSEKINAFNAAYTADYFSSEPALIAEINGFYPRTDVNDDCLNLGSYNIYSINYFRSVNPPTDKKYSYFKEIQ